MSEDAGLAGLYLSSVLTMYMEGGSIMFGNKEANKQQREKRCETCIAWEREPKAGGVGFGEKSKNPGRCHRFPPFITSNFKLTSLFILTEGDDWCMEWADLTP